MPASTPKPTALYRLYDGDGVLLYVGITGDLKTRWMMHSYTPWGPQIATREAEWFDTPSEAASAEVEAIQTEKPIHNVAHNFTRVPPPRSPWPSLSSAGRQKAAMLADLIRAEIDAGHWLAGHQLQAPKEMAPMAGVGTGAVGHAFQILQAEGVVYRFRSYGYFVSGPEMTRCHPL